MKNRRDFLKTSAFSISGAAPAESSLLLIQFIWLFFDHFGVAHTSYFFQHP